MSMIGHNNGPTMEGGTSWRRHCWGKARADLLPTLPLEIVRVRVRRAQEIGLEYKTYATVRAITGRDIVAFLFSSNALRMRRAADEMPQDHAAKLAAMHRCGRMLAAHRPIDPAEALRVLEGRGVPFEHGFPAPLFTESWAETRARLEGALGGRGMHPASVLLVGDTGAERGWAEAGRMAGYLPAENYFG